MKNILLLISLLPSYFLFAQPVIQAIAPTSGPAGSTVLIKGTGFSATGANNMVYFGGVKASVSASTDTTITVNVPTGATYHPITVTTGSMTAYSSDKFLLTFPTDSAALSTGSFPIVANYSVGAYPSDVVLCDFNDDGKPDIVTANRVTDNISVLKNNSSPGSITFTTKSELITGVDPKSLATGDLDADGKPDLVVANFNSGNESTIAVFRNTSAGGIITFAGRQNFNTGLGTADVSIADMDGDGKPDVVVSSGNSGTFSIFKNTTVTAGAITFAPKRDFGNVGRPDNLTLTDLDKDGMPDIIICHFSHGSISVLRNTSTNGNLSIGNVYAYSTGTNPSFITTGDFDLDGRLDIAVRNYASATISLFRNSSMPGLIILEPKTDVTLSATNMSVADLNGDGKADIFSGRYLNGLVSMLENTYPGSGNLSFAKHIDFKTGTYDSFVAVADLDGDGKPDLVAANTMENNVSILKNKIADPVLTNITPASGVKGTMITITGTKFNEVSSVTIGGIPADSFAVVSPTTIHAKVGSGSSGDVIIRTRLGTGSIGAFTFIPEIATVGTTNFCNGGSVVLSSTSLHNNQWYRDGNPINGATGNSYAANASGSYVVKTSNIGITTSSNAIPVNVLTVPTPVITNNANNHLSSSAVAGNQWYLDGAPIAGATGQNYQPLTSGIYTVKSKVDSCTSNHSLAYHFSITGIVDLGNNQYIKLYPNPVRDKLYLTWHINGLSSLTIQVMDIQGRQVRSRKNLQPGVALDLASIPPGWYVMKIYSKEGKLVHSMKFTRN